MYLLKSTCILGIIAIAPSISNGVTGIARLHPITTITISQTSNQLNQEYILKGTELTDRGKYFDAILEYTKAIDQDPQNPLLYYDRGVALSHLHKYEAAIADYTQAIKLKSNFVEAYKNRGLVYAQSQSYQELKQAVIDYDQAIKLAPQDATSYLGKGLALFRQGKNDAAIMAVTQANEINPELAIAYFLRASIYIELGNRELALSNYQKAATLYEQQGNQSGYDKSLEAIAELDLK
ncbi:tetratricopeptide repeat protein [Synechococcus sp. PCC 7502]|uniref:tetratricopeptide repeat protein n=1 Tax=Synechococcus sp. PCC 7502 TaxID=1173263 RepID=UPI00029F990A|nr:tetratricopeptide repeat protein [Synechococcus sp. PCC 7502]AFY73461.1 tetratricopeptide repeat protein [Synechococcus sp. PCC 7502]